MMTIIYTVSILSFLMGFFTFKVMRTVVKELNKVLLEEKNDHQHSNA